MNEETKMTPGEKLKKFRGKKTIREVADAVGVSESAYIKYERGEGIEKREDDFAAEIDKLVNG